VKRRRPQSARSPRQQAWSRSEASKNAGRASLAKIGVLRRLAKRCEAKRREDGQPCQKPGTGAGGRCRLHGGATPRGDQWHRIQYPAPDAPSYKLESKLRSIERRRLELDVRLAKMTPEERALYEKRRQVNQPSSVADRVRRRQDRDMRRLLQNPSTPKPESLEVAALESERAELSALEARLRAELERSEPSEES